MDHKQRQRRLRLLIKRLNGDRKKQAKKIDILCNDLIAAQRDFIERLQPISFAACFYESIIGMTDLDKLLSAASRLIKDEIGNANVTFFLRNAESFELYMFQSDKLITTENSRLEDCFSTELVESICKSNRPCTLDDMFAMGLQGNLIRLKNISGTTIPLGEFGCSSGFILIWRSAQDPLAAEGLKKISAVAPGLSRAIEASRVLACSGDQTGRCDAIPD
ncbi:MAG: hypothetical protein JSU70_03810 [Phycisphaerales bacterium]|nr:MAG: hypothetical protein JSU70_03810 [Phycisphaerales bacterium]